MADIVIEPGTANTTLIITGSAGRQKTAQSSPKNLPAPAMPALDYMTRVVEDTISISPRARLLSANEEASPPEPLREIPEARANSLQSSVRVYEEALRAAVYAGRPEDRNGPGIDRVSVSSEARQLSRP